MPPSTLEAASSCFLRLLIRASPSGCVRLPRLLMLAAGFKGWAFAEGLDLRELRRGLCSASAAANRAWMSTSAASACWAWTIQLSRM